MRITASPTAPHAPPRAFPQFPRKRARRATEAKTVKYPVCGGKYSTSGVARPLEIPLARLHPPSAPHNLPPRMSKDDLIEFDGVVTEVLPGGLFRVQIDDDHTVLAHLAGKMRRFRIKVVLGDRVTVGVTPYDPTRGRVVYRAR